MDFEEEFKAGHLFLENRKCRVCGIEKGLLADFYKCRKDPNLRSSYSYECKDCAIAVSYTHLTLPTILLV